MRQMFILEKTNAHWQLTLPRNHWIERMVIRFTHWPVRAARIGDNTTDYSTIYIRHNRS